MISIRGPRKTAFHTLQVGEGQTRCLVPMLKLLRKLGVCEKMSDLEMMIPQIKKARLIQMSWVQFDDGTRRSVRYCVTDDTGHTWEMKIP